MNICIWKHYNNTALWLLVLKLPINELIYLDITGATFHYIPWIMVDQEYLLQIIIYFSCM